jgi:hypothetical protein
MGTQGRGRLSGAGRGSPVSLTKRLRAYSLTDADLDLALCDEASMAAIRGTQDVAARRADFAS